MWDLLGFKKSPYDTNPLKPCNDDVELLVGREQEKIDLITILESSDNGVIVLSGIPGVGKTSFFNVVQFLLESKNSGFGPQLLCARKLCPVNSDDDPKSIALRALFSITHNIQLYCQEFRINMPGQIKKLLTWLSGKYTQGFDFGLQILGCGANYGRQCTLPPISDVTFEAIKDAIECAVSEIINTLKLDGVFIVLDNMENLGDDKISPVLMSFRDTLFTIPNAWWVLIGQSGLSSLLSTLDRRISERLIGPGLELLPLSSDQLHEAIDLRVKKFHSSTDGKSPLGCAIHKKLYDVSQGEIRFIFKYSNNICIKFVSMMRKNLIKINDKSLNQIIGEYMVEEQLDDDFSLKILSFIIQDDINGLGLRSKDKSVLKKIGELNGARTRDYAEFGLKSGQDFSSNYLTRFYSANLLLRQQEGRSVNYLLRGIALLANEYGYLD